MIVKKNEQKDSHFKLSTFQWRLNWSAVAQLLWWKHHWLTYSEKQITIWNNSNRWFKKRKHSCGITWSKSGCFLRLFSTDFENYFYFRLSSFMKSVKTHTAR